jgi:hypothetical protein
MACSTFLTPPHKPTKEQAKQGKVSNNFLEVRFKLNSSNQTAKLLGFNSPNLFIDWNNIAVNPTFRRFLNKENNIFDNPSRGTAKCVFVNRST